jgi:integrase
MVEPSKKFPPNLYKGADSWILDFYYRGQRYTENLGPVSRTVAKEIVAKRKAAAAEGRLEFGTKIEDLLFEVATEKYLEWYKAHSRPRSHERHQTSAIALKSAFSGRRLSQINSFLIEKYKLDRKTACSCADGPTRKENSARCDKCKHVVRAMADATINRELTMLKHLFNKCIHWNFAKANPVRGVKLFREDNGRTRYLSEEEARIFLEACNIDFRIVALAAMHTGFRKSELKALRWDDADFVNQALTVQSCYAKNGETRTVPMSPDLRAALTKLHDERQPASEDFIFTRKGREWKSWRTAFEKAVKRAGIEDFTFHDLRHCFGSHLGMANANPKAMMELMGHKDPKMTMRYTHLSMEYKRQAVAMLPQFGMELLESQQISQRKIENKVVAFKK